MSDLSETDEFFVGYLPMPAKQRRFLLAVLLVSLQIAMVVGVTIAAGQRDPGPAVWNVQELKTLEGVIYLNPFPLIRVIGPDGETKSILLVDQGKAGAGERLEPY